MPDQLRPGPGVATAIHDQLLAAVRERHLIAAEDLSGDWYDTIVAGCARDAAVLSRHVPCSGMHHHFHGNSPTGSACHRCGEAWPCAEIRDVAGLYGVEVPDA